MCLKCIQSFCPHCEDLNSLQAANVGESESPPLLPPSHLHMKMEGVGEGGSGSDLFLKPC